MILVISRPMMSKQRIAVSVKSKSTLLYARNGYFLNCIVRLYCIWFCDENILNSLLLIQIVSKRTRKVLIWKLINEFITVSRLGNSYFIPYICVYLSVYFTFQSIFQWAKGRPIGYARAFHVDIIGLFWDILHDVTMLRPSWRPLLSSEFRVQSAFALIWRSLLERRLFVRLFVCLFVCLFVA